MTIQFYRKDSADSRDNALQTGALRSVELTYDSHTGVLDALDTIQTTADCFEYEGVNQLVFNLVYNYTVTRENSTYSELWDYFNERTTAFLFC
jgi:hypothetical protein